MQKNVTKNKWLKRQGFTKKTVAAALVLGMLTLATAQQGGNFEITASTVNSGGGESQGGNFSVNGSIGQADASSEASGGNFTVTGGFWASGSDLIFKDGFDS